MRFTGVDEAGLGPTLGPLTVASSSWRAPDSVDGDDHADDFFAAFAPLLTPNPRVALKDISLLPVTDSKVVHGAGGMPLLTRVAQTFSTWAPDADGSPGADAAPAERRAALLSSLDADDALPRIGRIPWHIDATGWAAGDCELDEAEVAALASPLAAAKLRAAAAGWSFEGLRARVVTPGALNETFASGLNKHEAVMDETGKLLLAAAADADVADEPLIATADLQGGRRFYAPWLSSLFPDAWVRVEYEGPEGSAYRVERPGRPLRRFVFRPKADAAVPAVGLASILAKWLRERFMFELNSWFAARVRGLRPTAGYPTDARRFLAEVAAAGLAEPGDWPAGELVRLR